jgi:hypothetical protein
MGAHHLQIRVQIILNCQIVAKPGNNQWRFIVDLRHLNNFCVIKRLRMESLLGIRHVSRKGHCMFSFDIKDGFYALGIVPK